MRPTICDIAKRLGVSHATVSRALNNRLYVNEETRKRVLEVARELNYKPNVVARALASQKTNLVGVIVPNISVRLYYECSKGIEAVLDKHGLRALVFSSEDDEARFMAYIALLEEQRVDGIILAPGCLDSMHLVRRIEELEQTGVPVVIADSPLPQRNFVQIVIDDLYGAYLATRHLLELRRRKIAHICGPQEDFDAIQRLNGFKRALSEFKLNPDASFVSYAKGSTWQDGYVATRNMLVNTRKIIISRTSLPNHSIV
jgi:LacI family transcriptional regulator